MLTPLAKAMLVPTLTEAEIKDALGEDEVKYCEGLFLQKLHEKSSHIVPEQYSIQKEYPKHSVSRKNLFLYSNLRNNFQTNQKLGAF